MRRRDQTQESAETGRLPFYILFLAFACASIVVVFLPGWLSERLDLFPRSSNGTAILILLGALTLVLSLWIAARTNVGRRASQLEIGKR